MCPRWTGFSPKKDIVGECDAPNREATPTGVAIAEAFVQEAPNTIVMPRTTVAAVMTCRTNPRHPDTATTTLRHPGPLAGATAVLARSHTGAHQSRCWLSPSALAHMVTKAN